MQTEYQWKMGAWNEGDTKGGVMGSVETASITVLFHVCFSVMEYHGQHAIETLSTLLTVYFWPAIVSILT